MAESQNKRKKPNYYMQRKRKQYILEPGLRGFLCTCNFREKECVKESYSLLNTYADALKQTKVEDATPIKTKPESSDEEDIADELSKEINILKNEEKQKRFQVVESGAKNVVFIRTTVDNPVEIVCSIIRDILETKQQKTRFLHRILPVEVTCKANIADIKVAMENLIDKHFSCGPKTFAIIYNYRNNNKLSRDEVITEIGNLVATKDAKHSVDLKNAELTVVVEVIRGICLLSVIPHYKLYRKYNLIQLAESVEKSANSANSSNVTVEETNVVNTDTNNDVCENVNSD